MLKSVGLSLTPEVWVGVVFIFSLLPFRARGAHDDSRGGIGSDVANLALEIRLKCFCGVLQRLLTYYPV